MEYSISYDGAIFHTDNKFNLLFPLPIQTVNWKLHH